MLEHFSSNQALYTFLATLLTALATVALVWATTVLARVTKQMNDAATSPNVIVTVRASRWSAIHLNQHILNSGSGPAFDVNVSVKVHRADGTITDLPKKTWQKMEVLAPGQELNSYMGSTAELLGGGFSIEVSWALEPRSKKRITRKYYIDTSTWSKTALELGGDPLVQVAQEFKKLREDLHRTLSGVERLEVSTFNSNDRELEAQKLREWTEGQRAARATPESSL